MSQEMIVSEDNIQRPSLTSMERVAIMLYVPARNRDLDHISRVTGVVPLRVRDCADYPTSWRDEIIGSGTRAANFGRSLARAMVGVLSAAEGVEEDERT